MSEILLDQYTLYRGCLGDIAYIDAINKRISDRYNEKYPDMKTPFVDPFFVITNVKLDFSKFLNTNLSGDEYLSKDTVMTPDTYPWVFMNFGDNDLKPDEPNPYNIPMIHSGYQDATKQLYDLNEKGQKNIYVARMSLYLKEALSNHHRDLMERLSDMILGSERTLDILATPQAKSVSFFPSVDSFLSYLYKNSKHTMTEEELAVYNETYDLIGKLDKIVKDEMSPMEYSFHNRRVVITVHLKNNPNMKMIADEVLNQYFDFYYFIGDGYDHDTRFYEVLNSMKDLLDQDPTKTEED